MYNNIKTHKQTMSFTTLLKKSFLYTKIQQQVRQMLLGVNNTLTLQHSIHFSNIIAILYRK